MPLRLTLSTSMVVIIALGLSLASLREANGPLLTAVSGTTVVALTLSVLIARYGQGRLASFGFGAALFGWVAFALAFGPWRIVYPGVLDTMERRLSDFLPAQILVQLIARRISPPPDPVAMSTTIDDQIVAEDRALAATGIAHCLVSVWLGVLGGALATAMAARRPLRPQAAFPSARSNDPTDAAKPGATTPGMETAVLP